MTFNNDIPTTATFYSLSLSLIVKHKTTNEEKQNEMAEVIAWIDSEMPLLDPLESEVAFGRCGKCFWMVLI